MYGLQYLYFLVAMAKVFAAASLAFRSGSNDDPSLKNSLIPNAILRASLRT